MRPLHIYSVVPRLPENLRPLWDLAYNMWYTWKHDVADLFAQIDRHLWYRSECNPVRFLNMLPQPVLEDLAKDEFFLARLEESKSSLDHYLGRTTSAVAFERPDAKPVVAYFSLEYGIGLSLPIYSGGLGILAGDHLKSASDLNIPLVGIGLCYQKGYFRQYLTQDGWQQERYPVNDFTLMPMTIVRDRDGRQLEISLQLQDRELKARLWEVKVGRIVLYLLDTNIASNPPDFREITAELYGGDLEMRIRQEFLLGIGGLKALHAMGLDPKVIHMNEGHSAFAGLERIRTFMADHSMSFEAALELNASSSVFTTHTPVPAGNDRFPADLMFRYFDRYARDLGLAFKVFLALGRENPWDDNETFCMTVLALKLSRFSNGVSKLHGKVSRKMWQRVWPQYPQEDVPIGAITNGIHIPTWVAPANAALFDRYLGINWREDPDCEKAWAKSQIIPDTELWRTRERLRERLVDYVRIRLKVQIMARGGRRKDIMAAEEVLDPRALTIGFARRFATYKRAYLLLKDKDRFLRILSDIERPVQFILAGKAHPQDNEGKKIIQQLIQFAMESKARRKIVFLEDYDMEVARYLVQGCDIWLNTPRRPLEACGTSGMKAMANGVLNFSTLDGWWDEAYKPDNSLGWAIGRGEEYEDLEYQDFVESQTLYNILEKDIIPLFYDRGQTGLPRAWIAKMKNEFQFLNPVFNAHRMVEEYTKTAYIPAMNNFVRLSADEMKPAKELAAWRMDLMTKWGQIKVRNVQARSDEEIFVDEPIPVQAEIMLDGLRPDDIQAEIYAGPLDHEGAFLSRTTMPMQATDTVTPDGWRIYAGKLRPDNSGRYGFTVRVLPHHPLLLDPHSLGLIHWAFPEGN
ncbi:MAG: glycosyltransferase family 1 protein [Deltaproteobacteria bacterium]|nr:glycosyltransferase family 1 protein [Deltaproteobacteria bacterium]